MNLKNITFIVVAFIATGFMAGCNENITDFGFDGSISGTVKDASGNIISGDLTSNTLIVNLLGDGDIVENEIRVSGDGTFKHAKIYPKRYKVWLEGPVASVQNDTVFLDFAESHHHELNFVATPLITVNKPVINGSPTSGSVNVSYEFSGNDSNVADKREIYVSSVPYPTGNIGSGPFYKTKKVALPDNSGTMEITDFMPDDNPAPKRYFVRVGVRADGSNTYNYSDHTVFDVP